MTPEKSRNKRFYKVKISSTRSSRLIAHIYCTVCKSDREINLIIEDKYLNYLIS